MKHPSSLHLSNSGKLIAASLLAAAALSGQSYGQLLQIGASFVGRNNDQILAIDDLAGVFAQRDWNNLGNNIVGEPSGDFANPAYTNRTSGNLFADNGILGTRGTTAVTATVSANDTWSSDGPTVTPNDKLMKGIIKEQGTTAPIVLTLSGLDPAKIYRFLTYTIENGAASIGSLDLSGAAAYSTYYVSESNSFDGTFTLGNSVTAASPSLNTDYVQWDSVVPSAAGTITLTVNHISGSDGFGVAGFQLLEVAPPPGPDKFYNVGAGTGTWDLVTQNWRSTNTAGTSDSLFVGNDTANFGNLGTAGARTVNVSGTVAAGGINVNNSAANPYTIQGGIIGGYGPLIKDGAGSLTLSGANEFLGSATIKHGTVTVATIGDVATAGNLGRGSALTIGDTTGLNDAKLSYTGPTVSVGRSLTIGSNSAELAIGTTGANVTFIGALSGSGILTKSGPGSLLFPSSTTGFTGGFTISGGGGVTVNGLGVGTAAINVSGGSAFNYTGPTLNDTRPIVIGTGNGSIGAASADTRLQVTSLTATAGNLTVTGLGRVVVAGVANFGTVMPTIQSGATLTLNNETVGANTLPSTLTVSAGTLTLAPNSFNAGTPLVLSGGTIRLGHEGLQGSYYTGGADVNQLNVTSAVLADYFDALTPAVSNRTNFAGRTDLDFNNAGGGAAAPFADQGLADIDNLRARFTGKILITTAGNTSFFTASDDGSALYIDGVRVVNNNAFQGVTERTGTVNLSAGLHDIEVFMYEGGGGAGLTVSYTPVGGAKQIIPNNVLFAGDVNTSASTSPVSVSDNSTLQIAAKSASVGALTIANAKTLTVDGSADFASTTFSGTAAGINVASKLGVVTLGTLSGTGKTITKTGDGAIVLGSAGVPTGTIINDNGGLIVLRASNSGSGQSANPLTNATVNFAGGGLGFSADAGTIAPLTFNTNLVSTDNYRVEAGRFGVPAQTVGVTWAPANNSVAIVSGKTATFAARGNGYTLNVGAPVSGAGALNLEEGTVNFTAAGGITNTGGLTVGLASSNVTGPINLGAGSFNLEGTALGVNTPGLNEGSLNANSPNPAVNAAAGLIANGVRVNRGTLTVTGTTTNTGALTLTAASIVNPSPANTGGTINLNGASTHALISVSGGVLNATGQVTNSGAYTQSAGAVAISANSTHASVSITGGSLTNTGNLGSTGALSINGGSATINGTTSASSITGGAAALTFRGNVSSGTGLTLTSGSSSTFDPGIGNTAAYTGGIINLDNRASINSNSGITDMSSTAIHVVTPLIETRQNNVLLAVAINATGVGTQLRTAAGVNSTLAATPTVSTTLPNSNTAANTGGIDFPNGTSDPIFTAFFGQTINDAFTTYFTGSFKAKVSGAHSFRFTDNDDDVVLIADTNFNNVFDAGDLIQENGCCGADKTLTTTLAAGQELKIGWFLQDGGGGSGLKGYFQEPTGGTFTTSTIVRPGDAAQSGYWANVSSNNGGGSLQVQASSELRVKSFDGLTTLTLNGGAAAASAAVLRLSTNAAATTSDVDSIVLSGTTPRGSLLLGDNNTVTAGQLTLADGGTLVIDKAAGATAGGTVKIDGAVAGIAGVTASSIGTANVLVQAGKLLVDAPVTGAGSITATGVGGSIGGISSIAGPVVVTAGASIEPGDTGTGLLSVGSISLNGGVFKLELSDTTSYDILRVLPGGTVALGSSTLQLSLLNFNMAINDVVYIIDNQGTGAVTGTFNGIADQGTFIVGTRQFRISYDASLNSAFNSGGNDVALQYIASVPEPGSLISLLSGLGAAAGLSRFRRRR